MSNIKLTATARRALGINEGTAKRPGQSGPRRKSVLSEGGVQKACLDLLQSRGIKAWRNNSRVVRMPGRGGRDRPVFFGPKGGSDLFAILPRSGRFMAVEVKRPANKVLKQQAGKLTDDQRQFLGTVTNAGGVGICVWSVEDLAAILDYLDLFPKASPGICGDPALAFAKAPDGE